MKCEDCKKPIEDCKCLDDTIEGYFEAMVKKHKAGFTYLLNDDIDKLFNLEEKKDFRIWMFGQGCPIIDGEMGYYSWDVERFMWGLVWTTADGREIPFKELTDSHLQNILIDGYRGVQILKEAKRRKMKIPPKATKIKIERVLRISEVDNYEWVMANRAKNNNFYEKKKKSTTTTKDKN